jgi:hypothetical protein
MTKEQNIKPKKGKGKTKVEGEKKEISLFDRFIAFCTTLPGILAGIAAIITAIAGLYIAFGTPKNTNTNVLPTPIPVVQSSSSASPDTSTTDTVNCPEFENTDVIESGAEAQSPRVRDGIMRIKLTDKLQPVGAFNLKFHSVGGELFEIEKMVNSKCQPVSVEDLYNTTLRMPVGKDGKVQNHNWLQFELNGQTYSLRLMHSAGNSSVAFRKQ